MADYKIVKPFVIVTNDDGVLFIGERESGEVFLERRKEKFKDESCILNVMESGTVWDLDLIGLNKGQIQALIANGRVQPQPDKE